MADVDSPGSAAPRERPWGQVLLLATTVAALGAFFVALWQGLAYPNREPARTRIGDVTLASEMSVSCGEHDQLTIRVIHSPDKADWLQRGAEAFMRRCPNTQVELRAIDDFAAIDALVYESARPTLWMPTDDLPVDLLPAWPGVERGPSLLRSPLVVLLWDDRLAALELLRPQGFERFDVWASLACALPPEEADAPPGRLPAPPWSWAEWWSHDLAAPPWRPPLQPTPAQVEQWGRVDFMTPSPSDEVAGLAALALIAYGRIGREGLRDDELVDALAAGRVELESWLARCDAGGTESSLTERDLAQRLYRFGPSGPDGAILYERSAIEVLQENAAPSPRLHVVTPATTFIADHPAIHFAREDEPAGKAARQLVEFLLGPEPQAWAIAAGFRPASPDVELRYARIEPNPFVELRRFGIALELEAHEPPALDQDLLLELREAWQNATGRE